MRNDTFITVWLSRLRKTAISGGSTKPLPPQLNEAEPVHPHQKNTAQ